MRILSFRCTLTLRNVAFTLAIPVAFGSFSCGANSLGGDEMASTETGNPPVVDNGKIRLAVVGGQVHVIGDAGAVSPGGIAVTVANQVTGATVSVNSETDGSFDAAIEGDAGDRYTVEVKGLPAVVVSATMVEPSGADSECYTADETTTAIQAAAESAAAEVGCEQDTDCTLASQCGLGFMAVPNAILEEHRARINVPGCADVCVGPALAVDGVAVCTNGACEHASTCEGMEDAARRVAQNVVSEADQRCETVDDCTFAELDVDCFFSGCSTWPISVAGQAELDEQSETLNQQLCGRFNENQCSPPEVGCDPIARSLYCVDNRCSTDPAE